MITFWANLNDAVASQSNVVVSGVQATFALGTPVVTGAASAYPDASAEQSVESGDAFLLEDGTEWLLEGAVVITTAMRASLGSPTVTGAAAVYASTATHRLLEDGYRRLLEDGYGALLESSEAMAMQISLGTPTATGAASAIVAGNGMTMYISNVLVWGTDGTAQTPGWSVDAATQTPGWGQKITTQSPAWGAVTSTQTPGWSNIIDVQAPAWSPVITS